MRDPTKHRPAEVGSAFWIVGGRRVASRWSRGCKTAVIVAAAVFALPGVASGAWNQPAPGPLNHDPAKDVDSRSLASIGGVPHVTWAESNGSATQIRVKQFVGGAWSEVGGSLNVAPGQNADGSSITGVGGVPYVAWQECSTMTSCGNPNGSPSSSGYQIRVKQFDSGTGSWTPVGGPLNKDPGHDANDPSIATVGGVPYVAWSECSTTADGCTTGMTPAPYQIWVAHFNMGSWLLDGPLNVEPTLNAVNPSITSVGGVPYIAWQESDGSRQQIRVKRLDMGSWTEPDMNSLNHNSSVSADSPSIASVGGVPYVAWSEGSDVSAAKLVVSRLACSPGGCSWTAVGSAANFDPNHSAKSPSITDIGGVPFLAWEESNGSAIQIRVKQYSGGAWTPVGGPLNVDPGQDAGDASITSIGAVPYVGWEEKNGMVNQLRVGRLEPDFLSQSGLAGDTQALLTVKIRDFGVPLPIAFEYGPGAGFSTQTAFQTSAGTGADTITQQIGPLTPATQYSWRAFSSDSVRRTTTSPTQTFTTQTQNGPGAPGSGGVPGLPGASLPGQGTTGSAGGVSLLSTAGAHASKNGTITLTFQVGGAGTLEAVGTTGTSGIGAARLITYGRGSASASGPSIVAVKIKPTRAARKALRRHTLQVRISVVFTPTSGTAQGNTTLIQVRRKRRH